MESVNEFKICRFCGGLTDLYLSIFADEGARLELETKIARHLPVHISPDDGMTSVVCYPCVEVLVNWDHFVAMCVDMDAKLRLYQSEIATCADDMDDGNVEILEASFSESDEEPLIVKKVKLEDEFKKTEGNKYNCDGCGKHFKVKRTLGLHVQKCKSFVHRCDICDAPYKKLKNLMRHKEKEHLTGQTTCNICGESMSCKKVAQHMRSAHYIKKSSTVKCKYCGTQFSNKYLRIEHVKQVHDKEAIKCESCAFTGPRFVVKRHARSAHAAKRYPCSLCSLAFQTLHLLKMHMTAHSDLRCYTCDICGMGFKRLNNVRDHMKCHQQKSNQCQICGNFFARKRYLAIHEKTIHNFYADGSVPEEKGFECGTCGAKLKWKKNLLAHMRIHTGEKPYVCKICNQAFICHGSLRTHMAKHDLAKDTTLILQSGHNSPFHSEGVLHFNPSYLNH